MSVPFSNTNLRIPRGFGNLLEGLAKEVLREQPADIPTFAAHYFAELLKAREESGLDPAEWGARLEDRFHNNHAFKETATQGSSSSPKATIRNKTDDSETFGKKGTQRSISKELNANNSSDNSDVIKKNELDKKLDEESGEEEHGPAADISCVERADVDICAQEITDPNEDPEQVSENTDVPRYHEAANESVDISGSEFEPTPSPSFGGLANVDVCAEEINPPLTESTVDNRDMESPKPLLLDGEQSESLNVQNSPTNQLTESFIETLSHVEQDIGKQAGEMCDDKNTEEPEFSSHYEESEQGVPEITDALLKDTGPEEKSIENVYLEESTENDLTETSTTEQGTKDHVEEKDELKDNKDQETSYEDNSTTDFEPAAKTAGIKDTYTDYTDETYDSKSEIIDVLDEVLDTDPQCPAFTDEHEAENSSENQSTFKITDAMVEEDILESQTDAPVSDFQLNDYNSDTEITGDRTGEILNTDIIDTSEKDPITETINEVSDLDSDGCDAEDMNQDDKEEEDQIMTSNDLSIMHQDIMKTDDGTNNSELKEDVLASEMEEAHQRPLSEGKEREAEVITDEHAIEAQEQIENSETGEDQEDQLEDQGDKNQESCLDSQNQDNPESSEQKEECNQPHEEEDIMDIPLDDPEANKAAAKIQAGFRGHMTRKKMKPDEKSSEEVSSTGEDLNGSEGNTGGTDGVETDATSGPEQ